MSRLKICHYNHKQRVESIKEEVFLKKYFTIFWQNFLSDSYTWNKKKERDLRNARWDFFRKIIKENGEWIIVTWHNLSDRIETTFLNLLRGTNIPGIRNMSLFDKKNGLTLLRPLINLPKNRILSLCNTYDIPYFIDPTNKNFSISKRNKVRYLIQKYITKNPKKDFLKNFRKLYSCLDNKLLNKEEFLDIKKLKPSTYRHCKTYISFTLPKNKKQLYFLFAYTQTLSGLTEARMVEFMNFFQGRKWWKHVKWWYFFVSHGRWYSLNCPKYKGEIFWNRAPEYICYWKNREKFIIRFARTWDKYRKKPLKKRMINKKIPVFWRNYLLLKIIFLENEEVFFSLLHNSSEKR